MNIQDIRNISPCYDPSRYLPEDWEGGLLDILAVAECPEADRIWVVSNLIPQETLQAFASWCLEEAISARSNPSQNLLELRNMTNANPRLVIYYAAKSLSRVSETMDDKFRYFIDHLVEMLESE